MTKKSLSVSQSEEDSTQIIKHLRQLDKLPPDINVSVTVGAILQIILSPSVSTYRKHFANATSLMFILKKEGFLTKTYMDQIFDAISDVLLIAKDNSTMQHGLLDALSIVYDENEPEKLVSLYSRVKTRYLKVGLTMAIFFIHREKKYFFVLLDSLYWQNLIRGDDISSILKKHSLLSEISLKPAECDAIVSAVCAFLAVPAREISTGEDLRKYSLEFNNRRSAARILVVLYQYLNTPEGSKDRIKHLSDVIKCIVDYYYSDYMVEPNPLRRFLNGDIR